MAFADQRGWQANPAAATAVVALHGAAAIALIAGLNVVIDPPKPQPNPEATDIPIVPLPTPDVTPDPKETVEKQRDEDIFVPRTPLPPIGKRSDVDTTRDKPDDGPIVRDPEPKGTSTPYTPPPPPPPPPGLDPVAAKPSNSPGSWIRPNDYRSNWIRRDLEGTVGFSVGVGADGRVDSCRLTGSTGHEELDGATCRLIQRRARFDPARDRSGHATSGSYSGRVRWQLPQ